MAVVLLNSLSNACSGQNLWQDIRTPGAYVEQSTGTLYRVPKQAFDGRPMAIADGESRAMSRTMSRLVRISIDPYLSTDEARFRCSQLMIRHNF